MFELVEKKSIKGIRGKLWDDDFLSISSKRELDSHAIKDWLGFTENWRLADFKKAVLYYCRNSTLIDKELDVLKKEILEGYEATKSDKLTGCSTFNAVSLFWDIDVHLVVLFFVRMFLNDPGKVTFITDRWNNMIYIRLGG